MLKIVAKIILSILAFIIAVVLCVEAVKIDTKLLAVFFTTLGVLVLALIDAWDFYKEGKSRSDDQKLIKKRIHENLALDLQKLEILIPLLEDESHKNCIDSSLAINAPEDLLLDHLGILISNPKSKIVNESEIELIRKWLVSKKSANKNMTLYSRVEYAKGNKHELKETIRNLIKYFE